MPRLLAAKYIYSAAMDDCFNDYITTPPTATQQQEELHIHAPPHLLTSAVPSNAIISCCSHSAVAQERTDQQIHEQQIHTISSSDEDLFNEQNTIREENTNMSSEESVDFEGFDDYTSQNSSGLVNDISREDLNTSRNYLKRHSHINFNEYRQDSEGLVEPVDVENDDDIAIGEDGKIIYRPKEKITPKKIQSYLSEPYTPNKRKKHENETNFIAKSPTLLKTPPDQIVEVNSDSTTNSLKQKRQQINNKFQLNFCQQQNHKASNNPNRCSTESTSEFPVSSPSNPQQPRGGKYPARPPLLKNTLPADSFERQLAMITACNPQMTLAEKIQSWDCADELSDVEDVDKFDDEFKRLEKRKKLEMKQREKSGRVKSTVIKNYNYFRQMILKNIKEQKNQKYNTCGQTGGIGVSGSKCIDTSGSESSKSVVHVDDRPSTSAVAQQQLQQRRSKPQLCLETGEHKKRVLKDIHKRNQNSTTPPQTSSSDNERDCFQNSKNNAGQLQIHIHDTLICPSSSEEAVSQDVPTQVSLKKNSKCTQVALKNVRKKFPVRPQLSDSPAVLSKNETLTKNSRVLTDEEIDSVFRLHRLNRERDKCSQSPLNEVEEKSTSIIQMRLDCINENKSELLMEKKQELFKTPIIPQKYLTNPIMTAECQRQINFLPTKSIKTKNEINTESLTVNSILKMDEHSNKVKPDKIEKKSTIDDLDGVYHQQHEFCNYLGLTGMSTATAMANAVAELAQCNLARRSMRVLRQQQQERRDKSAKDERLLEVLKLKDLKEKRKREKVGCDITVVETDQTTVVKSDEGSRSQTSEPTTPLKKTSNNSTTKSQKSFKIINKEPEVKILCHIDVINKKGEKYSSVCVQADEQPVRKTLAHQSKQFKPEKLTDIGKEASDNSNEVDIRKPRINKRNEKTDSVEGMPIFEKENITRVLRSSPMSSASKSVLRKSRSQILIEPEEVVQKQDKPIEYKVGSMDDTESVTKSIDNKCVSPFLKSENLNKNDILDEHSTVEELSILNTGLYVNNLIPPTPSIIQQKLQMALEESRKSKPSIFIVQSLECKKEKNNNLDMKCLLTPNNIYSATTTTLSEINQHREINNDLRKSPKASTTSKFNKNIIRRGFKKRKGKKYPISKRKLRKRKIIVIKTSKPKQKSYESFHAIKRELRSSPKTNEHLRQTSLVMKSESFKQKPSLNKTSAGNETKSYRTVHTETKDLEIYLNKQNNQTKTRLMAKASALLERSRRMTLRGGCNLVKNKTKLKSKIQRVNLNVGRTQTIKPRPVNSTTERRKIVTSPKVQQMSVIYQTATKQVRQKTNTSPRSNLLELENVVVSSTTNTYDERPSHEPLVPLRSLDNAAPYLLASSPIKTKDQLTQCSIGTGVHYLNIPPLFTQGMRNPLKSEHGAVLYIYHELDILIVIQERLVSFWKCSKLINMLIAPRNLGACTHQTVQQSEITLLKQNVIVNCCNNQLEQPALSSTLMESNECGEWIQLGELRRLCYDFEISAPYANRICLHNSTPIYLEMRAQQLPKNQRDCNLLSMYINIYYYHDEDMIAKCNSIPLDSIQSDINSVNYTTLIDSRYFIITWPQENLLGKTRSGLCKYSLTPQLDTLASIREFKSMRHTIRYLECMSDDKLIGFGETQVSIWDYRSGDVLMNFDLEIPMGRNLGSIYFSSKDIEQNNMLILHQFRDLENNTQPQLITLACTVTHTQPSYRILQEINLPPTDFKVIKSAIKTTDHLVVTGEQQDELWISLTNPRLLTVIPNIQNGRRFYSRERSQLVELTDTTLNVNTLANHILQLAAGLALN